ncbi:MAG: hypothetical protein PHR35_07550 [Kiritimatiellae bacterium]|nr:hypothetical protein [Kiritimatiellia bacterium]
MKDHRSRITACLLLWLLATAQSPRAGDDLEALRHLMGPFPGVGVAVETKNTPGQAGIPPRRTDRWTFATGIQALVVQYSRFLNVPPHFSGSHPSLASGEMGIGLDGGPFGNWYAGNTIRILVDGIDIMQRRPADVVEAREGEEGRLRLAWKLDGGSELVLRFTVPEGGSVIRAVIALTPGTQPVGAIRVLLCCYPGGFAPAHGMPSHRYAATAAGERDLPPDFASAAGRPPPTLLIPSASPWAFYADHLQTRGALGLLALAEERATGEIRLSGYRVDTALDYPAGVRRIRLAFYAFELTNDAALAAFQGLQDSATRALRATGSDTGL